MKKKLLLLTIFLSAIVCSMQAQTTLWANPYGGNSNDVSNSVVTDASGNVYITGTFESPTLNIGGSILTNSGGKDMFVAKFNPSGNPIWAKNASGPGNEYGNDITVDASGNVYVIGSFDDGNVIFSPLPPIVNSGGSDFYIVKYNSSGIPQWAVTNTSGGLNNEYGNAIKYFNNSVYAIGSFESASFNLGALTVNNTSPPFSDVFVLSLDAITGSYTWDEVPNGNGNDYGTDIDVSLSGNIYITGYFESNTLGFPFVLTNTATDGTSDIFVAEYLNSPHTCPWAANPVGTANDYSRGIVVDPSENVYITGNFESTTLTFDPTVILTNSGTQFSDYFVAKGSPSSSSFIWAKSADANFFHEWNFDDVGKSLALDNCGHIYVTGWYNSYVINFGTGYITNATNNNYSEIFVAKYGTLSGNILNLFQGHEVLNDQGMGVAVNDCGCPVVTGWFNDKLNLSGSYLSHVAPQGTSDFYVSKICDYDSLCEIPCDNPIVLNTGESIPIGGMDGNWTISSWPPGISPTGVIACPWSGSGPPAWSYGAPLAGTQWISVFDSTFTTPQAPIGTYKFKRTFTLDSLTCIDPELTLCVMVDDTAGIFLNGNYLGNANSLTVPSLIYASGYGPFVNGLNTLEVHVNNIIKNKMAFDLKGSVCCSSSNPCDDVSISTSIYATNYYNITLTNSSSTVDFTQVRFQTGSGNNTLMPTILPAGWTVYLQSPPPPSPQYNDFTLFTTPGSYSKTFKLWLKDDTPFNPQQIFVQWIGWDNVVQDTVYCYDTIYIQTSSDSCCQPPCNNPIILNTGQGVATIPTPDLNWKYRVGSTPTPATTCRWFNVSAGSQWSYAPPLPNTQWISTVDPPIAPVGNYTFERTFIIDSLSSCINPELNLCLLVDDSAQVFLNGTLIGSANSMYVPAIITASGPALVPGTNTLQVIVYNTKHYEMAFDLEGSVCCYVDPCDSLLVAFQPTDSCCEDVYLTNNSSKITIENIQFSTASGNATLTPGTPPSTWTVTPSSGYPVNSFMVFPGISGSFSGIINLCVTPDPSNNPQQINITWMGFDTINDTIWCYDTLDIYCPVDTLCCDSCDNVISNITTGGSTVWNLLTAPIGVPTGPAVTVSPIPTGWRSPFPGTNWISYISSGGSYGSSSAPTGDYDFQTTFCICDTCAEDEKMSLHYCILVDDTAKIYLNDSQIGTATSEITPFISVVNGPFNIGSTNTIDVIVTNNPPYYVGFDFEGWLCCDKSNGINQPELENQVKIFPNPVNQNLYLKSNIMVNSIKVYSLFGQLVESMNVHGYQWNLGTVDLKSGLYFVKINTEQGIISKKVIIKH